MLLEKENKTQVHTQKEDHVRIIEKSAIWKLNSEALEDMNPASTLDFQPMKSWGNTFLLFKLLTTGVPN